MGYLLEHLGLSHIPGGSSSTAAATAARNRPGLPPCVGGRAEAGGLPLGALSELTLAPTLTDFIVQGCLAKSPGCVRGFLSEQALSHQAEWGMDEFQAWLTYSLETRMRGVGWQGMSSEMPEGFKKKGGGGEGGGGG